MSVMQSLGEDRSSWPVRGGENAMKAHTYWISSLDVRCLKRQGFLYLGNATPIEAFKQHENSKSGASTASF